jgi:hypothetical protein
MTVRRKSYLLYALDCGDFIPIGVYGSRKEAEEGMKKYWEGIKNDDDVCGDWNDFYMNCAWAPDRGDYDTIYHIEEIDDFVE